MTNKSLQDDYEMSQIDVAETLFLKQQTISKIEKRAMESFREIFENKGYKVDDLLNF